MKISLLIFLLCAVLPSPLPAAPKTPKEPKHYTIYAQFLGDTQVELSTGAIWMMDKGDCFPVDMFKDQQTKVVLKLGGATFPIETAKVRIMKDSEAGAAIQSYRKNVAQFLKNQTDKWKKEAADSTKDKPQ